MLPRSVESSNQHIAHQAAVILIAADYTGGVALGTLLHGAPLVGIHPQKTDYGASLWGAKADIKWIKPSVDDVDVKRGNERNCPMGRDRPDVLRCGVAVRMRLFGPMRRPP